MPAVLDAAAVRRWCAAGLDALRRAPVEIDALNVYPVPDGDTGTNLVLTMSAAVAVVAPHRTHGRRGLPAVARGALLGARGNRASSWRSCSKAWLAGAASLARRGPGRG